MKSADIAQMQAAEQADWKTNGVGGIVSAVDPGSGTITITVGHQRSVVINTSSKTEFKRFASDSVKYQDAKPGDSRPDPGEGPVAGTRSEVCRRRLNAGRGGRHSARSRTSLARLEALTPRPGKITMKDLATKKVVPST